MFMNKKPICSVIEVNGLSVNVVRSGVSQSTLLEEGIISIEDVEIDRRAKAAVSMAKKAAKVCKKPLAVYNRKTKTAELVIEA